jgi:hypothetical protein
MTGGSGSGRARPHASSLALLVAAVALPAAAWSCGACVEDKVAATYDHAVVQRAAAAGDTVVFCDVAGRFDMGQLQRAAARANGVVAHSVRVSREPAALSFAIDARRQSPQAVAQAMQQALPLGVRLNIVRVMAAPLR